MLFHFVNWCSQDLYVFIFLLSGVIYSIAKRKLTITAALTAGLIGMLVYKGSGLPGLAQLVMFFLSGTIATSFQIQKKQELNIAENNNGRRTTGQVIANGGIAAILGAIAWYLPYYTSILQLMISASLASATADTLSSELGSLYGSKFFDILTLKKAKRGPNGVISLEGTLFGIGGAALIALTFGLGYGNYNLMPVIIIAGFIGNISDSILGATLERQEIIDNNIVNFLNTFVAALVTLLFIK